MIKKFILFIIGLILIPVLAIGIPIIMGIGYGLFSGGYVIYMAFQKNIYDWFDYVIKLILILLSFPVAGLALAFCIAGGALGSGLAALLIIPAIFFHVYLFARSVIWWTSNVRNTS
jgi:hypothetical protein